MDDLGIDADLIAERERLDGPRARAFIEQLPTLVEHWQAELGLVGARIMPGGVLSGVFACERLADRRPVVLKLAAPEAENAVAEAAALRAWGGRGACQLLFASSDARVMLLSRIVPGVAARPEHEQRDIEKAAQTMAALHLDPKVAQVPPASRELSWRFDRAHVMLDGGSHARGLISHDQIAEAHRAAVALHEGAQRSVLLHGDFLNKNLLLDEQGTWWAIDPRPCIGDPCLDAAFWALAYRPGMRVVERCRALARAAGLDPDRVWAWARAFAVSEAVLVLDRASARAHASVASI